MISEADVYRSAQVMLREHGDEAGGFAGPGLNWLISRLPIPSQLLRFGNLSQGHFLGQAITIFSAYL
jgi:hypothetical protein